MTYCTRRGPHRKGPRLNGRKTAFQKVADALDADSDVCKLTPRDVRELMGDPVFAERARADQLGAYR